MLGRKLGGIEQALVDYCEALKRTCHDVLAVVHPEAAIIPMLNPVGVACRSLPNLGGWDRLAAWRLRRIVREFGADICIAHGNRAAALMRHAGGPVLVGVTHNYSFHPRGMDCIFSPTRDLMRHMQKQAVPAERMMHVPNMVRVPQTPVRRERHSPPVIGAMGRMVEKKGFDTLLHALARLKAKRFTFRAILAGDGEEAGKLRALCHKLGLDDSVTFSGWAHDKAAFFDGIDIFCLPSRHEPFGIVLLEAMAQGLPCVSTLSEGPGEILHDGIDGILVPVGDDARMAHGLEVLLTDARRAALMGRNAYDEARAQYDLPVASVKLDLALRRAGQL